VSLVNTSHHSPLQFNSLYTITDVFYLIVEVLGWTARTWSSQCPYNRDAFLMQTTTLVIAPTAFAGAAYVILGRLIVQLGPRSSKLKARTFIIAFVACDLVSLIVQAVGGSIASAATNKIGGDTRPGTNIMVAGIVFQLVSMTIFVGLLIDFMIRCHSYLADSLTGAQRRVIAAMVLSVLFIYTRSVYRTIELQEGWTGYLITHEKFFIGFDATLMILAVAIYHVPGVRFQALTVKADNVEKSIE
jgi:hypothetical protein